MSGPDKYIRILNMLGIEKILNICKYALELCLNMPETEPKITSQVT